MAKLTNKLKVSGIGIGIVLVCFIIATYQLPVNNAHAKNNKYSLSTRSITGPISPAVSVQILNQFSADTLRQEKALRALQKNIPYPSSCREENIEGAVVLEFIVSSEGQILNIKTIRSIGGSCEEQAVQAVKDHATFKPTLKNGKAVDTRYILPIVYKLAGNEDNPAKNVEPQISPESKLLDGPGPAILLDQLVVIGYSSYKTY